MLGTSPGKYNYNDVIMGALASQITSLTIVYSGGYSGPDQRKHQSSASLAFVRGIHRRPVNSPRKGPVTRKICPFYDVIMMVNEPSESTYSWWYRNNKAKHNSTVHILCEIYTAKPLVYVAPHLNVSRLVLQLFCLIHWSQMWSREWRCSWSSANRWCSNYIWVINKFIAY